MWCGYNYFKGSVSCHLTEQLKTKNNMEPCEKEEYRGYIINVYYDETPDDPRNWSNVATFVCEHRHYSLGDEHDIEGCIESLFNDYVSSKAIIDHFVKTRDAHLIPGEEDDYSDQYYEYEVTVCGEKHTRHIDADTSYSEDSIAGEMADELDICEKMQLLEATGEIVTLPISMYEHSGITLWLGSKWDHYDAQWDCSSIGFAYVEKSTANKEGMLDPGEEYDHDWRKWAYAMMEGEMETYDQFVRGEVYGYMIEDENGEEASDALLCGCWGFFGDEGKEDMLEAAKADIDSYLKKKKETRKKNLHTLVDNVAKIAYLTFTDGDYMYRIAKDMFGFEYIEKAKIYGSVVGEYVQMAYSSLGDEILNDMVEQIKKEAI